MKTRAEALTITAKVDEGDGSLGALINDPTVYEDLSLTVNEDDYRPIRHRIAMVFQGSALFDSLTVGENIAYPIREHFPQASEDDITERVHKKLEMVNLPDAAALWPAELSGGMRKRVGLARAIAVDPEVILWDEPTSGLDPISTRMINDMILLMQKEIKTTSIAVTHDMASAERVSDRIATLANHTIVEVGSVEQMRQSKHPDVRAFIHAHV